MEWKTDWKKGRRGEGKPRARESTFRGSAFVWPYLFLTSENRCDKPDRDKFPEKHSRKNARCGSFSSSKFETIVGSARTNPQLTIFPFSPHLALRPRRHCRRINCSELLSLGSQARRRTPRRLEGSRSCGGSAQCTRFPTSPLPRARRRVPSHPSSSAHPRPSLATSSTSSEADWWQRGAW